jgi:hypothetical protein
MEINDERYSGITFRRVSVVSFYEERELIKGTSGKKLILFEDTEGRQQNFY